ncbi:MAG: 5'/3'-nucleotidase SurE, partial [Comamonadaceae bacterium]
RWPQPFSTCENAMEGYLFGVPAIAFSQVEKGWGHLDAAARKARELVQFLAEHHRTDGAHWLLNVNIPNRAYDELKPFKVCRLGRRHAAEKVISQTSPHGVTMYWIGGAGKAKDDAEGTDFHATLQGHPSITPLKVDLTDHDALRYWGQAAAAIDHGQRT